MINLKEMRDYKVTGGQAFHYYSMFKTDTGDFQYAVQKENGELFKKNYEQCLNETLKFYAMFADTIVLSRELSLRQVKKITEQTQNFFCQE